MNKTQEAIKKECDFIKDVLLQKNSEYGDAALNPVRIFSTSDTIEQLNVRMDDKLSRIKNKKEKFIPEDTELDLIGYLVLKRIKEKDTPIAIDEQVQTTNVTTKSVFVPTTTSLPKEILELVGESNTWKCFKMFIRSLFKRRV